MPVNICMESSSYMILNLSVFSQDFQLLSMFKAWRNGKKVHNYTVYSRGPQLAARYPISDQGCQLSGPRGPAIIDAMEQAVSSPMHLSW